MFLTSFLLCCLPQKISLDVATIYSDPVGMRSIENVLTRAGIKFAFDDRGMAIVIQSDLSDVKRAQELMRRVITPIFSETCIGPRFEWSGFEVMRFRSKTIGPSEDLPPGFDEGDERAVRANFKMISGRETVIRWRFRPYYTDQGQVEIATEFSLEPTPDSDRSPKVYSFNAVLFHRHGKAPYLERVEAFYEPR